MVVFVTGGTRGIGKAVVKKFFDEGHTVLFSYKNNEDLSNEMELEMQGVKGFQCDATNSVACADVAQQVLELYGKVDVLVNNAGITKDKTFAKMNYEDWELVIDTNLKSMYGFTHVFYNKMRETGFGRIVNMASVVGLKGAFGQVNYAAAKAGIIGFTKALALEGASKNITVNALAPGYVATEMVSAMPEEVLDNVKSLIPMKRLGTTQEIAELVYFLSQTEAAYITGQVFSPNGGFYL